MTGFRLRAAVPLFFGLLSACALDAPEPASTHWDGRWIGHFESSLGLLGCPSRGVLDLRIEKGTMNGSGSAGPVVISIRGAVKQNGEIVDGVFMRDGWAAAVMAGTFIGAGASGRWQGTTCEGTWTLQRFSSS